MMNDITWIEAARVLASNALAWNGTVETSIADMGSTTLGRPLTRKEHQTMQKLAATAIKYYGAHPSDVDAILATGSAPTPKGNRLQIAALTQVSLAMLNLDEAMTRE